MILDKEQQFSDAQALTGSVVSTNVIDLAQARDLFSGELMVVVFNVKVAADVANGDETYQFDLEQDDNEGFSSGAVIATRTIDKALLIAGFQFTLPVPQETTGEQFLRVSYVLGGTTPSITISAHLVPASFIQNERTYPSGFTVS